MKVRKKLKVRTMSKVEGPVIIKGKRLDGRSLLEMRPISIEAKVVPRAHGSAYFSFGGTKCIAAVYGPILLHPKHLQDPQKAHVTSRYDMAPFSVTERKRPGPDRRAIEISKVIKEALEPVVFLEEFPKAGIELTMEIIQADSGTRVTAINAASIALADAGVPMKDMVSAVSVGRVEGNQVVDLSGVEEGVEDAVDMPVAMRAKTGEITLLQMDGDCTLNEFKQFLQNAKKACLEIYEKQKAALREKYKVVEE